MLLQREITVRGDDSDFFDSAFFGEAIHVILLNNYPHKQARRYKWQTN